MSTRKYIGDIENMGSSTEPCGPPELDEKLVIIS